MVPVTFRPADFSHDLTAATWALVAPKRACACLALRYLPYDGGARVGHGLGVRGEAGRVPAGEVDPGGDLGAVGRRALVRLGRGPRGLGARERVPAGLSAACAAGMPSASAPASSGSVAAMLTPARSVARLDLIEPPAMRFAREWISDVRLTLARTLHAGE